MYGFCNLHTTDFELPAKKALSQEGSLQMHGSKASLPKMGYNSGSLASAVFRHPGAAVLHSAKA